MSDPSTPEPDAPTERERKLTPPAGFRLPSLPEMLPGWQVGELPSLDLRATYFDTGDLTLARSGITIRHRTGDGPPTWTLKLPVGHHDGRLVRRELDIEGPRRRRPAELARLVDAHLRGRRLVAVADLHTARDRLVVRDDRGRALVEVAHDVVSAHRGRRELGAWEEVEIELRDPVGGDEADRAVERALRSAGCERAPTMPKLVRALGAAATAPAEVAVPRVRRHPGTTETVRHALARSVEQILRHDPAVRLGGDPEDLHQLRVGIRRLRSDLRTFRHLLPADGGAASDGDPSSRLREELGWIADQTNHLRDLDVLQAWVEQRARSMPPDDQPAVGQLVERCQEEAATERAALRRSLATRRYRQLVHDLVALIDLLGAGPELDEKAEQRARRQLDRELRRRWTRLDAAVARASGDPTDAALHRARIAAKQCRATAEAVEPLAGRTMRRFARSLAELQGVLGAAHDAAVMDALLRRSSDTPEAFAAGRLAALALLDGQAQQARWPQTWAKVQRRHGRIARLG